MNRIGEWQKQAHKSPDRMEGGLLVGILKDADVLHHSPCGPTKEVRPHGRARCARSWGWANER